MEKKSTDILSFRVKSAYKPVTDMVAKLEGYRQRSEYLKDRFDAFLKADAEKHGIKLELEKIEPEHAC